MKLLRKLLSLLKNKKRPDDHLFINRKVTKYPQVGFSTSPFIKKPMGGFIDTQHELLRERMNHEGISIGQVIEE